MSTSEPMPLAEVVRSVYVSRNTGVVTVELETGAQSLYFRQGEVFLSPTHPAAGNVRQALEDARGVSRLAESPELQRAMVILSHELTRDKRVMGSFRTEANLPANLLGPLPTALLVMELSVYGLDFDELVSRLGGTSQRYQASSVDESPALEQLPGLEPEMAQVLASVVQPAPVGELLRGAGSERMALLKGLAKLRSVGLVVEVGGRAEGDTSEALLPPRLLKHFLSRVAEDLEDQPFELPVDQHQKQVAELVASLGKMNHYQLLGVGLKATEEEVLKAYNRLARVVHPRHASKLGFEGRDEALAVLFEQATEAYLSLSDPRRRASYNMIVGIQIKTEVESAQREEEKREVARQHYRRAVSCLAQMDYSLAIDLFKEAARLDPRAEYFARLGAVQTKNPNWYGQAIGSYRRAVELSPDDAGIRAGYGEALEAMGKNEEAIQQYQAVLELMPKHPGALDALERLGARRKRWR